MTLDLRPSRRILLGSALALTAARARAATDRRYLYDAKGQLIWTGPYGGEGAAYAYDKAGNRTFVRSGPYIGRSVSARGLDPAYHYDTYGWQEGRNPSALFNTSGYLDAYGDVRAANINPLNHYHESGWRERRDPSGAFDTLGYLQAYGDIVSANINPMTHYLQYGFWEGRGAFGDNAFRPPV
jgi:hypothetical protein